MKSLTLSLFTILFLGLCTIGFAQNEKPSQWCGSEYPAEMIPYLQQASESARNLESRTSGGPYTLPLDIHVFQNDDNGNGGMSIKRVNNVVCETIEKFEEYGIEMYLNKVEFITNPSYNENPHTQSGIINLLYANNTNAVDIFVHNVSGQTLCGIYKGFATGQQFIGDPDIVQVSQACWSPSTLIHELGHYLGLPHTFFGLEASGNNCNKQLFNREKVDGSNCSTTGDFICDTGPDYHSDRWGCTGCIQIDPDSVTFRPDPNNYMSYAGDNCVNLFSNNQVSVMKFIVDELRQDLLQNTPPDLTPITEAVQLIQPGQDDEKPFDVVSFKWSSVPGASSYYFEINRQASFNSALILESATVTTTSYISTELNPNQTYHWRVIPFNNARPCLSDDITASGSFSTNDIAIDVEDVEGLESFNIFPNPVSNNQPVIVTLQSKESMKGDLEMYNVNGQLIHNQNIQVAASLNSYSLDVQDLPAGLYVIHLEFEEGTVQKKLIIN